MSQSRKKFKSRSKQSSSSSAASSTSSNESDVMLKKLDGLRSNVKESKKQIVVDNNAQRNKAIAAILIIVVGMSGVFVISQFNPGTNDTGGGGGGGSTAVQAVTAVGGFKKDLAGTIAKSGDNKYIITYVGADFCPYCAVERWAIYYALSQFGSLTGYGTITSSEGGVPTFDFSGSTYTSSQIEFQPAEVKDNNNNPKDTTTSLQNSQLARYDTKGTIPFVCIGGIYFQVGAGSSLNYNSFANYNFNTIMGQLTAKSGQIYDQVKVEGDYIVSMITTLLTTPSSSTISTTSTA